MCQMPQPSWLLVILIVTQSLLHINIDNNETTARIICLETLVETLELTFLSYSQELIDPSDLYF